MTTDALVTWEGYSIVEDPQLSWMGRPYVFTCMTCQKTFHPIVKPGTLIPIDLAAENMRAHERDHVPVR